METTSITLPNIIPADKAIEYIRKYEPTSLISKINDLIEAFITNISDINTATTNIDITAYCSGYTVSEVKALIKHLIKAYKENGYSINYDVCYYIFRNKKVALILMINSIRFNTTKLTVSALSGTDIPPTYKEAVKKNPGFIKRLACGLL